MTSQRGPQCPNLNETKMRRRYDVACCADDFVNTSLLPILVNKEDEIFKISSDVTKFFKCNHEEGDPKITFHALKQMTNIVVIYYLFLIYLSLTTLGS